MTSGMQRLRPLLVDNGRNPYQLWVLALCAFTGALGLVLADRVRSSVIDLLPHWAGALWYLGLLLSGSLGLVSTLLGLPQSLLLQRAALILLGGLLTGYSVAVVLLAAGEFPVAAINLASAAIASWWRVWHITHRDLPRLRAAVAALAAGDRS